MNYEISIFPNIILIIISLGISYFGYFLVIVIDDIKLKNYYFYYLIYNLILFTLAHFEFFSNEEFPPRMVLVLFPLLICIVYLIKLKSERLNNLYSYAPYILVLIHSFRILMEYILILFYQDGVIPIELTLHGRNFDIVIGLLSIPTAYLLYKKHRYSIIIGNLFNLLGLLALLNILSIAIPSAPSPFRMDEVYAVNYFPTYFPGITVIFVVPMAIYFHILSLKQLKGLTLFKNHF